jgi:predicted ATPase
MQTTFITGIHIDKVRHLTNVDIALSENERKHLILTGKNGSGKTSLLEAVRDFVIVNQREKAPQQDNRQSQAALDSALFGGNTPKGNATPSITVLFSEIAENLFDITFAYLSAERSVLDSPNAIEAVEVWGKTIITRNASKDFLKYILNLYVQYLSAKDSGSPLAEIEQYKAWFDRFTQALRDIYDCQELKLKPDMKKLKFLVTLPGREPFGLHEMSDGYRAFLEILMELLMRFESADGAVDYNQSAIVIIDEIETHLHVELQKRALPFLTQMFPCVQFIVSTHSPFVITSLPNAVVFDLEKREQLKNPSYFGI